ncbi:TetR/AcrR family transcriptional regulator [Gottschalkiaceae bacterium SANA]|nr:TetR/AcrR family transcriptional regulator [Gottschalkiaceae bacterium SANA]
MNLDVSRSVGRQKGGNEMGQKESKRNIKEDILVVASELMMRKGVKETSLKDIANAVGISKGTLYYHFSSKDDMIFEIADKHLTEVTDRLGQWVENIDNDASFEHVLSIVIERVSNLETRSTLHIYLLGEAIMNNETLRLRFKMKYNEWFKLVETTLKSHLQEKKIDVKVLSFLVVAILDGYSIQKLVGIEGVPFEGTAKMIASIE